MVRQCRERKMELNNLAKLPAHIFQLRTMIKMQVIGNLGKDCLVNNVNGRTVINFSVAHTEKIKDAQGNLKDKTIWVECAYWTDRTGISPYLKKGTQVYVDGAPDIRTYTTNDGRNGASLSLRVSSVQLLGGRSEGVAPEGGGYSGGYAGGQTSGNGGNSYSAPSAPAGNDGGADDLPF